MSGRLLFIDDEDIVLKSCRRIFSKEPYEIDVANSGEEGLQKAQEKDYDIVITDLKMPGMGGLEVLKKLRDEKPEVTVVIFTGYANVETARDALKNGAFDYIPKPFTPDELRDVIKNAMAARQDAKSAKMLDLMAIVSHELKSPVSAVYTTASTLHRGYFGKLEPEQQKIIETIIRNCEYLEDIIRSYIDLSKMEIDDLDSFNKDVNLVQGVIREVIEVPEVKNNIKRMPIVAEMDESINIFGDSNLLIIVVRNLVNNAIKYGKEDTPIKLSLMKDGPNAVFSVTNEGVGISVEDIRKRLFRKFERLKQKGTEGVKGSGLGLYICKKIVEKHSGKIWVESEEGKWVTFFISLPMK
ncbi:MAG: response regulator [Spirochaetes bacterium]|nr:response regulator [Spirochaetota bacterium]